MQRFPCVTVLSCGEVTLTISLSCTCSVRLHPTPQNVQMVVVSVCFDSSQVPSSRLSCSRLKLNAPVGQTSMQLPQYTHALSGSGVANSVEIRASNPRPATEIAKLFCHWSPHAST